MRKVSVYSPNTGHYVETFRLIIVILPEPMRELDWDGLGEFILDFSEIDRHNFD